jgi:hypothetical protein
MNVSIEFTDDELQHLKAAMGAHCGGYSAFQKICAACNREEIAEVEAEIAKLEKKLREKERRLKSLEAGEI